MGSYRLPWALTAADIFTYFSLSHALSTYFPQPHVQSLCPTPTVVFLLLQSAVSLLCETPDLWPQFSVKLEFIIHLISSDLCLTPLILPPLSYCISVPSLFAGLFPKSIFFPLLLASLIIYISSMFNSPDTHTYMQYQMYSLDMHTGRCTCLSFSWEINKWIGGKASSLLCWTTPTHCSTSYFIILFQLSEVLFQQELLTAIMLR